MSKNQQKPLSHDNSPDVYYGRKSTGLDDEGKDISSSSKRQKKSLGRQRGTFDEYYKELPPERRQRKLVKIEEAKSAYVPGKRDGFNEVITIAQTTGIHYLYIDEPKRISRNHEECGRIAQLLADGHIGEIITMCGKRYSRADSGQLILFTIEGGFAWKDSADKGWMVSGGMLRKAKEGGCTGWAPLGYLNVCDRNGNKSMEIDPVMAPKVKRLFMLAATGGYSLEVLKKEAKKVGMRTRPTERHPEGLHLQKTTIHYMLTNPEYKGMKRYKGVEYKGQHKPIISVEIWNRVQLELMRRSTHSERPKKVPLQELFLMAGCVKCGHCKARSMSPYKVKKGRYIMYECKNPNTKCRNCINQDDLVAQFEESLQSLAFSEDEYAYMRKTLKAIHEEESKNRIDERKALEKQYQGVQQQIADVFMNIEEARRQGVYDTVSMKLAQLKMRKDELQIAMEALHDEEDTWIDHVVRCFELTKLVHRAIQAGSPPVRQAVLKSLASNYYVTAKKLHVDWVSPFKEKAENTCGTNWLPRLDSNQ